MQVILIQDVNKLGFSDDIVNVKPGFARNYLLPQGFAVNHNATNVKLLAERMKQAGKIEAKFLADLQNIVDKVSNGRVQIGAKVGTTDKIFGSVGPVQISEAIKKQLDVVIDRRKISIKEGEIKVLGTYTAILSLHKDQSVEMTFDVVAE